MNKINFDMSTAAKPARHATSMRTRARAGHAPRARERESRPAGVRARYRAGICVCVDYAIDLDPLSHILAATEKI